MKASLDELYELFYIAAYGCNRGCERAIKTVLYARDEESPNFSFFEFFLTQPLPTKDQIDKQNATTDCGTLSQWHEKPWGETWEEEDVYVLAPFAPRLAERATVVPALNNEKDDVEPVYRTIKTLRKIKLKFRCDRSFLAREGWKDWGNPNRVNPSPPVEREGVTVIWQDVEDSANALSYRIGLINGWTLKWQKENYPQGADAETQESAKLLSGLFEPLCANAEDEIKGIFVPIASSRLFYGGVWVLFPGLRGNEQRVDCLRKSVGLSVAQLTSRTYLPVLTVLHEHWLEKLCLEQKPVENGIEFRNAYLCLQHEVGMTSESGGAKVADNIESLLQRLWKRRELGGPWEGYKEFKDSCIFESYLICSESMVSLLDKVTTASRTLRKSGETLPACLVIGGAGSGKEQLAKMLRLFSDDGKNARRKGYCRGKEYVVNLSAIRPGPITVAVLAGVEHIKLEGVLTRIRRETKGKPPPTLRLDEFNSMDPDSQGVLLRFLDNSEIIPLGSVQDIEQKEETDCLVIGIMNEDPEDISRERAMEFFQRGEYLGKFLGDLLYEHFFRVRRLRPDIMYRMIRNGKFSIPQLRERKEDIPLLFHLFVRKELKAKYSLEVRLHFPLEVLERLTGNDLLWPGNVRQLQALAKVAAETVQVGNGECILTLPVLERAIKEVGC